MYNLDTGHENFTCPTALTIGFGYRTSKVYNVFLLFLRIRYDMQDMLVNVLRILKPRKTCNLSKHSNPCCVSCWELKFIMDNSYWLRSKSSLQGVLLIGPRNIDGERTGIMENWILEISYLFGMKLLVFFFL